MTNVLVTGAAGYIGSILSTRLAQSGHRVMAVDNLMYKQTSLADAFLNRNFTFHNLDIRDQAAMKPLLKCADVIIPLAAIVGAPACAKDEETASSVNVKAPLEMFKSLSTHQIILMPTTNSAYGTTEKDYECDEKSPLNPISKYAKDKVLVEKALLERANVVSLRLATVFGLSYRMRMDLLVNNLVQRSWKDRYLVLFESHARRNYIHVRDVVQLFLDITEHPTNYLGQVYNVGLSSANLTKKQLAEKIKTFIPELQIFDSKNGSDPDKRDYMVSNKKIEITGFAPKFSLDFGIEELLSAMPLFNISHFSNI
jgi:nucleoside-diphosphate-sugar epimerase